jgi:pimeloyl-ACP methyl ester carboxylesterase
MYQVLRPFRVDRVALRGMNYHVRLWGPEHSDAPPLVLVHGWMDVGASYQFVVDAFSQAFAEGRRIIAPDWRGFGHSRLPMAVDTYHFPDYLADLDRLLDHYAGEQPVDLVGHSMGGNIAMFYAGARPARIRRLASLEGFGMPATAPDKAPARYAQWMDETRKCTQGETTLKDYADAEGVAQRLMKTNPRLAPDKAAWLARHWAEQGSDGRWRILGDAAHKVISAQLYRVEEALALYAAITAPLLHIEASEDSLGGWWKDRYTLAEFHERLRHVRDYRCATVQDAGHMLHHDQPQVVATLLEEFFASA